MKILRWLGSPLGLRLQWLVALGLLVAGAVMPMFSFRKFYVFNDTFSLVTGVTHLAEQGEWFLFALIVVFSVLTPLYKLLTIWTLIDGEGSGDDRRVRRIRRLMLVGKWSMADVFLIAVVAAALRLGGFASISVQAGLYVFALGVLHSMLLVHQAIHQQVGDLDELIRRKMKRGGDR